MSECCDPLSYQRMFSEKEARRRLKGYRKKGLDNMASGLVEYVADRGVADKSVLEIGGGVGDLQVELLKAGAANSVNVELSSEYEAAATELIEDEGLDGRVERLNGDFVEQRSLVETADVVVMNRVVCCYPWFDRIMEAAIDKTGWLLALAIPRDRQLTHAFVGIGNWINRRRCGFEAFVHPVEEIEQVAARAGLTRVFVDEDFIWRGLVFERV